MKNENKQPENCSLSAFADKKQKEGVFYSTIGSNIIRGRNALGMTQEILADKLGISRVSIGNIESGKQRLPVHLMNDVAKVLNIDLMGLFKGIDRSFAKQPASLPESKEVESVPVKSAEEYKGECFDTIEGAWDWHSRSIPEDVYSLDELTSLLGEEIMFKRDFEPAVRQLLSQFKTNPIEVIKNRIKERIKELVKTKPRYSNARINELLEVLKFINP